MDGHRYICFSNLPVLLIPGFLDKNYFNPGKSRVVLLYVCFKTIITCTGLDKEGGGRGFDQLLIKVSSQVTG